MGADSKTGVSKLYSEYLIYVFLLTVRSAFKGVSQRVTTFKISLVIPKVLSFV